MTLTAAAAEPAIQPGAASAAAAGRWSPKFALSLIAGLWLVIFFASLFTPPVLDDADGTHANAARQMLLSGDWVTLRVNNVRYLEKAPLPYWIAAASIRLFGVNAFAVHLPQAIAVLLLALLGWQWAREAFSERAALYTGLGVLTSAGVFLFTRVFIPDVLLSLLLAISLYCLLKSLEAEARAWHAYAMWAALALAVLTKGLVAIVFLFGAAAAYLILTGEFRNWRRLRLLPGIALFLLIAAPWHILAGLRNTGGMDGHGFFWFYFINEHVLRFLGRRIPRDYNKLPGSLYWSLHLVWLFPWSLFLPLAIATGWRYRATLASRARLREFLTSFGRRTALLLAVFSTLVIAFFSLSTNQEYYTFPAYLPLLMLLAVSLAVAETRSAVADGGIESRSARRWLTFGHAAFSALGILVAAALAYGLWVSRGLPALPNVGDLLAHRGVGDYTLSMSSLFDLTGPSFAALRLPAALALAAFALGPTIAWAFRADKLRVRDSHLASTIALALTSAVFLVAAHVAFARFAPMLSSQDFAATIQRLELTRQIAPNTQVLLFGDQAYGSSIPFYLDRPLSRPALLVDGRSSSMLFGSAFPDAQPLFLTSAQLAAEWGSGPRKILFVPLEHRDDVDRLLGSRQIILAETAGKALLTDRPLKSALDSAAPLH
ncbi:MAG TPA: glycosyltransferase family 39 protein [Acidobacteriaceae bacterium]|nr:glycosyltransferase family 39 protein [Acidobacteriaceae bacterium]